MSNKSGANLATDSVILTFVQCITLVTGIVQTMILSRVLTRAEYGTYSQGVLVINFITPLLLLGMGNAINFFYNQGKERDFIKRYIDTIFTIVTVIGGIAGILIIFLKRWICLYFNNEALGFVLILVAFRPLLKNIISLYQPLFISNNMAKMIAVRNLIIGIVQVGIIAGVLLFSRNLALIFALLLVLDFVQVLFFKQVYEKHSFHISIFTADRSVIPEICKYALPLAFSSMVGTLSINMDKMLIGRMLSTEEFATYSNMAKELPFSFVVASLTTVVTPVLIRLKNAGKFETMKQLWSQYIEVGLIVTWILVSGGLICGKEMIIFLYSEKYVDGYWVFIVYLLVTFIRFTYFGMLLTIFEKTRQVLYFSCASLFANLILNYFFIIWFGMVGPAIATLVAVLVMNGSQLTYGMKLLGAEFKEIFDIKFIGIFFAEILVVSGITFLAKEWVFDRINNNTLVLILSYMLFVGIMSLLQFNKIKEIFTEMNSVFI